MAASCLHFANMNLDDFKVKCPPTAYYIPNFITQSEEAYLLQKVYEAPKPRWKTLANRRLQNWGGAPHPKGMIIEKLPAWLQEYADRVATLSVFGERKPNHVLVNEYLPGQGIMPHLDGSLFYPTITTVNLGSHTVLDFYLPFDDDRTEGAESRQEAAALENRHQFSLWLQPRSLLILQDDMYHKYLHGIKETCDDTVSDVVLNADSSGLSKGCGKGRCTRVSLTIRHVPKTSKIQLKLGRS